MKSLIIHYDTLHAQGDPIKLALQGAFGDGWRELAGRPGQNTSWSEKDLKSLVAKNPNVKAVSSPYIAPVLPSGLDCFPIAMVRHPLDRLLAIFESWHAGTATDIGCAPGSSLAGFCKWALKHSPETLLMRNAQCLRFSAPAWDTGSLTEATPDDLAAAKRFLALIPAVGVADRLDHSLQALAAIAPPYARIEWPTAVEAVAKAGNTLQERLSYVASELGPVSFHAICEENSLDLALYEFCCAALTARLPGRAVDALLFSGERFIPSDSGFGAETAAEHLLRYRSVAAIVAGKRVLDAACGEGYGTAILAENALSAVGMDNSLAAVQHATSKYAALSNCQFRLGDAAALPFADGEFDVAISYETIEHIDASTQRRFVAELHRVLKPDGVLIMSSPNRVNYSERRGIRNHFHIRELDEPEFRELLSPFRLFKFYRQGIMAFATIWCEDEKSYAFHDALRPNAVDDVYFVAICGRESTIPPGESLNSLSYNPQLSYAALQDTLLAKEQAIQSTSIWAQGLNQTCTRLQAELDQVSAKCVEMGEWGQQLQKAVEARDSTILELTNKIAEISSWCQLAQDQHAGQRALIQERETLVSGLTEKLSGILALKQEEQSRRVQAEETLKERITWGQEEHAQRKALEETLKERERFADECLSAQEALRQTLLERDAQIGRATARHDDLERLNADAQARWSTLAEELRARCDEVTRLDAALHMKEAEVRAQVAEFQTQALEVRALVSERDGLQRTNHAVTTERDSMAARLHELERGNTRLLEANERKEVEMTAQVAGLVGLVAAADKRVLETLEALASHEFHAAEVAAQLATAFSQTHVPLTLAQGALQSPATESHKLHDMKLLVASCQAELQRLTSEAVRARAENAYLSQELRRIQGGHCHRVSAAYWRLRDRLAPTGSTRRRLAKCALSVLRHPWLGGRSLIAGDLDWLSNGLDRQWYSQRALERPHEPRNWSMRLFPRTSKRRMLMDMAGTCLRSPFRLLLGHPVKKWGTAFHLLRKGQIAEMWMRFQQVRGEAIRRHQALTQPVVSARVNVPPLPMPEAAAVAASPMPSGDDAPILALPSGASPEVTIIIPAYDHWDLTLACLQSLAATASAIPFEVILADDCSQDLTVTQAHRIVNLRVMRNEHNLGFLRTCNRAAGLAHGRWICLLNNDTQVTAGWLDELVMTARADTKIGAVGAKLVYPDGRLQEAGSLVWSDGTATNWGIHGDADAPCFAHAREVDYCSAACLLIDAELFRGLGGFDDRYAPAFYEDTDLAFRVRDAGRTVVYQPLAVVFHHGGASCGDAPGRGIKDHQERNRLLFAARWSDVLRLHHPPKTNPPIGSGRATPMRRLLVVDHLLPTPDRDAGSAFISEFMAAFRALGYHVSFIGTKVASSTSPEAKALQRAGIEVLAPPHVRDVRSLLADQGSTFAVIAMVRHHVAQEVLGDVTCYTPHAKRIFIPADLHWLRSSREAEVNKDPEGVIRSKREQSEELSLVSACAATVIHSSYERSLLLAASPKSLVEVLPWIVRPPAHIPPLAGRRGVAFVGGFSHRPNIDAVLYLASAIWPLVRARIPDAELSIVGAAPPPHVEALAGSGIRVLGHVPDLTAFLGGIRVTIAPLRWGAGFKGKVATSVAHGVPAVVTPVAAEGMGLEATEITVGTEPEQLAEAAVALLTDDFLWARMSASCLAHSRTHWAPEAAQSQLIGLLSRLAVWPTEAISDRVQAQANSALQGAG